MAQGKFVQRALCLVVWLFSCLAFLVVVAWMVGRIFTDRYAWSQWLWWMPTPLALLAGMFGFLTALRPRRKPRARRNGLLCWAVCGLALTAYFIAIEHRFLRSPPQPSSNALSIAHWNMSIGPNPPVDLLIDKLIALDADVTVLAGPSHIPWEPAVIDALSAGNAPRSIGTLVIMSKFPVLTMRPIIATDRTFVLRVEIDATAKLGRPIVLYAVDLPSNPRIARYKQAQQIRQMLDENENAEERGPDVIVGDFNTTRGSASLARMFPNMPHAFDEAGHGYGASFSRLWLAPLYHLDHVLLGDGVEAKSYELIDLDVSRHRAQKTWIASVRD